MTTDKRPLLSYLKVQKDYEAQLIHTLGRVAQSTEAEIKALAGKRGIGAKIRADQLRLTLQAIYLRQAELWKIVGSTVEAGRREAAAAAVATNFHYESMLIEAATSPAERKVLLQSATQQAMKGLAGVEAKLTGLTDIPLSARVYNTAALSNGQLKRVVINAVGRGVSWNELASDVREFIRPDTPGGAAYAAKRLARTELNNAFHAAAVVEGRNSPFIVGQLWNLSGSHPKPDECNRYAESEHFNGGGPGVYRPADVPGKPHPQCLCYLTPVTPSREEFMSNLLGGKYDGDFDVEPPVVKVPARPPIRKIDPVKHETARLEPTIQMMTADGEVTREAAIRILSRMSKPADIVLQQGPVTLQVRSDLVSEEQARHAIGKVWELSQLDKIDRDISVTVREFGTSEQGNLGKTLGESSVGGDSMVISPQAFNEATNKAGLMPAGREGNLIDYVLTHEYGHMRAAEKHDIDIDPTRLSRYAKSNGDEAYAEAYAEWIVSKGKTTNKTVQELAERFSWPTRR